MNVYFKNYGIWLGGSVLVSILIGRAGFFFYGLPWLMILAGTIVGTVMTHKELKRNIQFGKAIGPVLAFSGLYALYYVVMTVINMPSDMLSFALPFILEEVVINLVIGISVLLAAGTWYMFEKAGKPGWAMLVPIYNLVVMCEIAKKPGWWVVLFLIPVANIVFLIMMLNGISKNFGKDAGFTVGLVFFRQIFFAILGYGDAVYVSDTKGSGEGIIDDI